MNYEKYFKELFESITDYRKIVLLIFLIKMIANFCKNVVF